MKGGGKGINHTVFSLGLSSFGISCWNVNVRSCDLGKDVFIRGLRLNCKHLDGFNFLDFFANFRGYIDFAILNKFNVCCIVSQIVILLECYESTAY